MIFHESVFPFATSSQIISEVESIDLHTVSSAHVFVITKPPGFVDKDNPTAVCRLRKAIYGLKQAPRA